MKLQRATVQGATLEGLEFESADCEALVKFIDKLASVADRNHGVASRVTTETFAAAP